MLVQILCSGSLSFENLMNALRTETWEGNSHLSENIPPVSNKPQNYNAYEFLIDLLLAPWNSRHLAWWKSEFAVEHKYPEASRRGCYNEGATVVLRRVRKAFMEGVMLKFHFEGWAPNSDAESGKHILAINTSSEEGESLALSGNDIVLARLRQRPCGE